MPRGRLWAPLRSSDYRRLWAAQLISVVGDKVDQIALGVLVYEITGSELQMGIMLAISMLPAALFGIVAGVYVDRWDRRRTMIAADIARAALVCTVPFVAGHSLIAVYGIAFLVASVSLFFEPAKLSLIPDLVTPDDLLAANSLDSVTVSVAELAGLVFAGGLVALLGTRSAFFLDAGTYLLSAVFVSFIAHRSSRPAGEAGGISLAPIVRETSAGLQYVWGHPVLRDLLAVYSVAMMGVAASTVFIYTIALDRYAAGAPGLAVLDGAITVGLLVGSVAVGRGDPSGPVRTLLRGLFAFGALVSLLAFAPSVQWAAVVFFASGIANMYFYVPLATVLQQGTVPAMRGRVFAAKQTLSRVLSVIGFIGAGALAEGVGLTPSILAAAALIVVMALFGWSRPHLRAA